MMLPKGIPELYGKPAEGTVAELTGNIYGLHSAGRTWFICLRDYLLSYGLKQLITDQCVFVMTK